MTCKKCGSTNSQDTKFCVSCGELMPTKIGKTGVLLLVVSIVVVAVMVGTTIFLVQTGMIFNSLSGRYVSQSNDSDYIEFTGGNNVTVRDMGTNFNGTFTLEQNNLTIEYSITFMDFTDTGTMDFTVSEDKKELASGWIKYVKK